MPSPAARRNAERLALDKATERRAGRPLIYVKVPGPGRLYYDPAHVDRPYVSEHYVTQVYRKSLDPGLRAEHKEQSNLYRRNQMVRQSRVGQNYFYKELYTTGVPRGAGTAEVTRTPQFAAAYNEMLEARLEAHVGNLPEDRNPYLQPGSRYSNALVELGMRTGEETFAIGQSDPDYINTVVRPFLQGTTEDNDEAAILKSREDAEVKRLALVAEEERIVARRAAIRVEDKAQERALSRAERIQLNKERNERYDG